MNESVLKTHTPQRLFYLKISGGAMNIPANNPEEAIAMIKNHMHCYCFVQVLEIGVDVDECGWPITKAAN